MTHHPYKNLSNTQFWSSGVKLPVSSNESLAIDPLLHSLTDNDAIVSGGSCFAQYIGSELSSRGFDYLRSELSGDRVESFGLGNIYTVIQLKQWLEFSLGVRTWGKSSTFENENQWYDLLLPHRDAMPSEEDLYEHRLAITDEIVRYLKKADVFVFTVGLTETWRHKDGDVYPGCPGTLVGEFDETIHFFHNCTFEEIHNDLVTVENMLARINPTLRLVFTVSPVPLTATASDNHVLLATTYSKSVIRAALGQYCNHSQRASYFPSYELISHPAASDWRFEDNLRTVSDSGVQYVMGHAFGEDHGISVSNAGSMNPQPSNKRHDAACEEELLDSYSRLADSSNTASDIILAGDCHMGKLASGFRTAGIEVEGGIVMHGSSFTDYKFEISADRIFIPTDSEESKVLWFNVHDKMKSMNGDCDIITNIGFHTHRTINRICNHLHTIVLTEKDIADYFEEFYVAQVYILRGLTQYGKVWLVEDPDFYAFIGNQDDSQLIRDKNFHQYCNHMRKIAHGLGIEYLNPCDQTLQNLMKNAIGLRDIISPDGFLGSQLYYEYCAAVVNESIGNKDVTFAHAA